MPAVPSCIIEPIWEQFSVLLPKRNVDHPLGCHRPRIPDRVVFEKLVQVLVFGCAYSGGSPMMSALPRPYAANAMSG
jgi:transposase